VRREGRRELAPGSKLSEPIQIVVDRQSVASAYAQLSGGEERKKNAEAIRLRRVRTGSRRPDEVRVRRRVGKGCRNFGG
jgi:hypothetical protein